MAGIVNEIKNIFVKGSFTYRIIAWNVAIFILQNISENILNHGAGIGLFFNQYFGLYAGFFHFIQKPWGLFTYMFFHYDLGHIFSNMFLLYFISRVSYDFLSNRRIITLYYLGGIGAGLLYLITSNVFSAIWGDSVFFNTSSILVGASGAVMALVVGTAVLVPNYTVHLLLLGAVRMKYLALGIFILSSVLDIAYNTGGKVAHLGGAIMGWLFIKSLQSYNPWLTWLQFEWVKPGMFSFKRKTKMTIVKSSYQSTSQSNPKSSSSKSTLSQTEIQRQVDRILDKINASGYDSLSKEEREFLHNASKTNT